MEKHNELRKKHHVPPLVLNRELCEISTKYAQKICNASSLEHSDNKYKGDYIGENLYWASGMRNLTGKDPVQDWYDEIKDYNFSTHKAKNSGVVGHFTQVVWKGSEQLGIGFATKGREIYVVANYYPAGNYIGQYKENVLKP